MFLFLGFGSGLYICGSLASVGDYFEKYRPLAFGVMYAGSGIGNICFPWITSYLIDSYSWRGALLVTSAITLHICVAAMFIFKPSNSQAKSEIADENHRDSCFYETKIIFQNKKYILQSVNSVLLMFSASVVFTHIAAYSESEGFPSYWGSLLISVLGGASAG